MNGWNILERWFKRKLSLMRIDRHIANLKITQPQRTENIHPNKVCVSCVQCQIQPVKTLEEFIDTLAGFVKQAVDAGSQLVVFPEYNFFDLFGLIPGFHMVNVFLTRKAKQKAGINSAGSHGSSSAFTKIFASISQPVSSALQRIISLLAKEYGVYIYTGSYLIKEEAVLYNSGSLFGPDGSCIGAQHKIQLTGFECALGLGKGSDLKVYKLPIGNVAFPICMDATYFETFRVSVEQGADIVILPIADMDEYDQWKSLRGIWPRVQEAQVYGLKASLNGWIAGMHFTGKAGIFAPLPLTPEGDGIVAISDKFEGSRVVTAVIDIEKLHDERKISEYHSDSNPVFEAGYVERVYF